MGGGQALTIGLAHLDLFHWVLGFSAAIGGQFANAEQILGSVSADPNGVNHKLRLLWVSCGKQDFLYQANKEFVNKIEGLGVHVTFKETEGAHVWSVWRKNLDETAALLFATQKRISQGPE